MRLKRQADQDCSEVIINIAQLPLSERIPERSRRPDRGRGVTSIEGYTFINILYQNSEHSVYSDIK